MVDRVLACEPERVCDVASGTAGVASQLADRSDADVIVGVDLSLPMLHRGAANVTRRGGDGRVRLVAGRAEQLPFPDESFDALTFTYLLRYVDDPAPRHGRPRTAVQLRASEDGGAGGRRGRSGPRAGG